VVSQADPSPQPVTVQLPDAQVAWPPFSQVTAHGAPVGLHVTVQVDPTSQTTSQPPPEQSTLHVEPLSQSVWHPPPRHV
jgi:hypothetical protein